MPNPFTPSFGKIPPYFAGREYLISEMLDALDNGPGDPNQTSIFVGARGTGKTATLGYIAQQAQAAGWVTASVTAVPGMLDDLLLQAQRSAGHLVDMPSETKKVSGTSVNVGVMGGGVTWSAEAGSMPAPNWRLIVSELLDRLEEAGTGLLLAVDEVNPKLEEVVQLVTAYQHLVVEERRVALLMAGLPHKTAGLVGGESASFLRRAARKELGNVPDYEIGEALQVTAELGGKKFNQEALSEAVAATKGFPYMMQLVGFRSWVASGDGHIITAEDVSVGIGLAANDMKHRVLRATLDELSERDIAFLMAMLEDSGSSCAADMKERLQCGSSNVSTYKRRLLDRGVIQQAGRMRFEFALPLLREYLPVYVEENMM